MMTIQELTELLIRADRLGLTTYKEAQAAAWKEVLDTEMPTLDLRLATEAVKALAARAEQVPARGIRPYDLMTRARQIAGDRISLIPVVLPSGLSPAEEIKWSRAWAFAVGRGANREAARTYCEQATGITGHTEIESAQKHDIKNSLEKYRRQFGKKETK